MPARPRRCREGHPHENLFPAAPLILLNEGRVVRAGARHRLRRLISEHVMDGEGADRFEAFVDALTEVFGRGSGRPLRITAWDFSLRRSARASSRSRR